MFQTFTGKEYLKIDIANNFGLDKEDWNDRIKWFDENESNLMNLYQQAEEPALMFAGILAWEKVKAGLPTGYMIGLDATCSGLQILAAMTNDRKAALLCNVVDAGKRNDAYTAIYKKMCEAIGEEGRIQRSDTKKAIMTSLYGSTAIPKKVFGEGILLQIFYDAMMENAPKAWELNEAFLSMWNPEALSYSWVLPDNFHVHTKVMSPVTSRIHFMNEPIDIVSQVNKPSDTGRSIGANVTHSIDGLFVREIVRMASFDQAFAEKIDWYWMNQTGKGSSKSKDKMVNILVQNYKESGFISSRILEYVDENNIHLVPEEPLKELLSFIPKKSFTVVSVHDCFKVLPNYGNDVRRLYNYQLHKLSNSNILSNLISQIMGQKIIYEKDDLSMSDDILEANYALS